MPDFGAINTLFSRYAAANDWPDQELLESCFTEDATFTLHIAGADSLGPSMSSPSSSRTSRPKRCASLPRNGPSIRRRMCSTLAGIGCAKRNS